MSDSGIDTDTTDDIQYHKLKRLYTNYKFHPPVIQYPELYEGPWVQGWNTTYLCEPTISSNPGRDLLDSWGDGPETHIVFDYDGDINDGDDIDNGSFRIYKDEGCWMSVTKGTFEIIDEPDSSKTLELTLSCMMDGDNINIDFEDPDQFPDGDVLYLS